MALEDYKQTHLSYTPRISKQWQQQARQFCSAQSLTELTPEVKNNLFLREGEAVLTIVWVSMSARVDSRARRMKKKQREVQNWVLDLVCATHGGTLSSRLDRFFEHIERPWRWGSKCDQLYTTDLIIKVCTWPQRCQYRNVCTYKYINMYFYCHNLLIEHISKWSAARSPV